MNDNLSILLSALIGGGSADWSMLDKYIDSYEVDPYDVVEEAKQFSECPQFNDLMYSTLSLGFENIREKVLTTIKEENWDIRDEIKDWIEYVDSNIFVNYLDSFIDIKVFRDYDMNDLKSKKQVAKFIADVWKEIRY